MKPESLVFALAGIAFGLIAGWVIGTEQTSARRPAAVVQAQEAAPASTATGSADAAPRAAVLDQSQVTALTAIAERDPSSVKPRVQLANLYFDAERYDDAIKWYTDALKVGPDDVNVSTDLGVCYY